jgi:hypothetical protein
MIGAGGNLQYLYDGRVYKIAEFVLGIVTASVTFSSIPGTYRHLMVVWSGRGDNVSGSVGLIMQANGDTTANYDSELYQFHGSSSGPFVQETIGTATPTIGDMAAASATAAFAGGGVIEIENYAGTTFNKQATGRSAFKTANTTGNLNHEVEAWFWRSTAAINALKLFPSAGNLTAGCMFELYGLN